MYYWSCLKSMCFGCLGVREVLAVLRREDATLTQLDAFVHCTYLLHRYFPLTSFLSIHHLITLQKLQPWNKMKMGS